MKIIKKIKDLCISGGSAMIGGLQKVFTRPPELDKALEETRRATETAQKTLRETKATLDGEEKWFSEREDGKEDKKNG